MKVKCVDAKTRPGFIGYWNGDVPVEGQIYTVVGTYKCASGPGFFLLEIKNNVYDGAYAQDRFRPVTDISIFEAMLKTEKIDA